MKKILAFFMSVVIFSLGLNFSLSAGATKSEGIEILGGEEPIAYKVLEETVSTIEVTVRYDADKLQYDSGGIIFGNLDEEKGFNISVEGGGCPRITLKGADANLSKTFSGVNVYTGDWVHIAFVLDRAVNQLSLYINGEFCDSVSRTIPDFSTTSPIVFSNDSVMTSSKRFSGKIKSCGLYSDVRSADTIKADSQALSTENGIAVWDFSDVKDVYEDLTLKGYDAKRNDVWLKSKQPITDFDYSMVLMGDIQYMTYIYPDNLHRIFDWIIDNKESKKIGYVIGLGDITDRDTAREWKLASEQFSRLDSVVPYSVVRGNHDGKANIDKYFNTAPYNTSYQGSYNHTMLNTCRKFTLGTRKYLLFALDYTLDDNVIAWADKIIKNHPDHNVIITSHIYLAPSGAYNSGQVESWGGTIEPEQLWDKLIKKHKNITLVISGHSSAEKPVVTNRKGDNGNTVTQMLVDYQWWDMHWGEIGMLVTLHFKNGSNKVAVEVYSTVREKYFRADNQFEMEIETIEAGTYSEEGLDQTLTVPALPPTENGDDQLGSSVSSEAVSNVGSNVSSEGKDLGQMSSEQSSSEQDSASSDVSSAENTSSENSVEDDTPSAPLSSESSADNEKGSGIVAIVVVVLAFAGLSVGAFVVYKRKKLL